MTNWNDKMMHEWLTRFSFFKLRLKPINDILLFLQPNTWFLGFPRVPSTKTCQEKTTTKMKCIIWLKFFLCNSWRLKPFRHFIDVSYQALESVFQCLFYYRTGQSASTHSRFARFFAFAILNEKGFSFAFESLSSIALELCIAILHNHSSEYKKN